MTDAIGQRLAAAAQAVREYELSRQHDARLRDREQSLARELGQARLKAASEQEDVGRLEHVSLTRVLASLHGSRDDRLAREKAEAAAARYQLAEVQRKLDAAHAERESVAQRLAGLAGAPQEYAGALAAREQQLENSADPRGARLLALADQRGRLAAELGELYRAGDDAASADAALCEVADRLGTAAGWSTFDTWVDHGMIANAIKHDRIDEAARAAETADRYLAALQTDLAHLGGYQPTAPHLQISAGFRLADIFFNNIFSDLAIGRQIRDAQAQADYSLQQVRALRSQLAAQTAAAAQQLQAMDAEREQMLTH